MLSVPIYDTTGNRVGEESIDPADFGGTVNKQLLHDVVVMHLANRRVGTVNTRGRADVAGSGKKLFRQKGTGNARAGAKRTNKRKGGGVAFARRNRDYSYSMPKKAVRIATRMAILSKFQDGQAIVIDGLGSTDPNAKPKTQTVVKVLKAILRPDLKDDEKTPAPEESKVAARKRTLDGRSVLIGTPALDSPLHLSARNIEGVQVAPVAEFNTYDVLKQRYLILTREALATLKDRVKDKVVRRPALAAASPAGKEG
jgi:large subunit ribosomal protein L4